MKVIDEIAFATDPTASLRDARESGEVVIQSADGTRYSLRMTRMPSNANASPLDVGFVPGLRLSAGDILNLIREGRERSSPPDGQADE